MLDVGNAKYAATFQKLVDTIAIRIQREYKGGPKISKAIKDLVLPSVSLPPYPTGTSDSAPDPREINLWQQSSTETIKHEHLIDENKKQT
jgi:hypothetical protein